MHSLELLPYDVIQLIAVFLLPYDILALGATCRTLEPILDERCVWLQVAESVSQSRPLPFTAEQALELPVEAIMFACLDAERIATRWAKPHIYPRTRPIKISFPDNRVVQYFTFLPGSRHLMIYDVHNVVSCWSTEGALLASWSVTPGAKLTRWKPCDDSEPQYAFECRRLQAVEIMIEMPGRRMKPTHCEIIVLLYVEQHAEFTPVNTFQVPRVYEPFSAMTQDELRGGLVSISGANERVGIYLTDQITEMAICIDTGLALILDRLPQALLSSQHMVLYWETVAFAHTVTYDVEVLRDVLAREGRPQDDESLCWPVPVAASSVRVTPFQTVSVSRPEPTTRTTHSCAGCGSPVEAVADVLPSTDLSRNSHAYPFIIPKWPTLKENLRQHRTRSILTFSRTPSGGATAAIQDLTAAQQYDLLTTHHLNMNNVHFQNGQLVIDLHDGEPVINGNLINEHQAGENGTVPAAGAQDNNNHNPPNPRHSGIRRTTITHHYFDYDRSSGCGPPVLVRTVLAEAPLRRPQSLRIPRRHVSTVVFEADGNAGNNGAAELDNEFNGEHGIEGEAYNLDDDGYEVNVEIEGIGAQHVSIEHIGAYEDDDQETLEADEDFGYQLELDPDSDHELDGEPEEGGAGYDELALENEMAGLALQLGDLNINVHNIHPGGQVMGLNADAALAFEDFVHDPFGGSPVMGYGGRCAMWVEEHPRGNERRGRVPVLRIVTFPTYEPSFDLSQKGVVRKGEVVKHPELEVAGSRIGTLHLPDCISLESAYTFDLDDVRGLIGLATTSGELWLVDFS